MPGLEAFYGGAAGGGKSDALLMAALQYAEYPGYKALLLRKTFADLSQADGLLDRSREWLTGRADWNEGRHRWTFPSGAILEFGHMQYSKDRYSYQGAAYDFVGFDEVTHFEEADYIYLFSRMRQREGALFPLRMRAASNPPPNPDNHWTTNRFILKKPDPSRLDETEAERRSRICIPAKVEDNPGLDVDGYDQALRQLDPQTYAQLRHGDWMARQPGNWVFDSEAIDAAVELGSWLDVQRERGTIPQPVKGLMASGTDYGDYHTVFEPLWPLERGGAYIPPGELHLSHEDLEAITGAMLGVMANYPGWWAEARYDSSFAQSNRTFAAIARRELGQTNLVRQTGGPNTVPVHFNKDKDPAIRYLRLLMGRAKAHLEGENDGTRILAISPKNALVIEQLRGYEHDDFGKPLKGKDDAVDALIAAVSPIAKRHRATVDAAAHQAKQTAAAQGKLVPQGEQVA